MGVAIPSTQGTPVPNTTTILPAGIKETTMDRGELRTKTRQENRPKNQHWAPQFYLRYFAIPERHRKKDKARVWIFSKDEADGDESLTTVRAICAKPYLYSPVSESGERGWGLESKLGESPGVACCNVEGHSRSCISLASVNR